MLRAISWSILTDSLSADAGLVELLTGLIALAEYVGSADRQATWDEGPIGCTSTCHINESPML
jgi:hypothetical protein